MFKKNYTYDIKKSLLTLVGGALLFATACKKENGGDVKPETPVVKKDTTLVFGMGNTSSITPSDNVKKIAEDKTINKVFVESDGKSYFNFPLNFIRQTIEPVLNISDKVEGRGNLPKVKVTNIADSLWFVEKGFTINQK